MKNGIEKLSFMARVRKSLQLFLDALGANSIVNHITAVTLFPGSKFPDKWLPGLK